MFGGLVGWLVDPAVLGVGAVEGSGIEVGG